MYNPIEVMSMPLEIPKDIMLCHEEAKGRAFIRKIWGKQATFVCAIGNTETGKIPGISAAGAVPEITDFTPAADVELLYFGWCKCINGVPVTPNGIPTPGLITVSATKLGKMPIFAVVGGVNVRPNAPFFDLDGKSGKDIRTGKSVEDPLKVFERAVVVGEQLSATSKVLVVGESIAGGTTTALGVLTALGYDAFGKVSSTLPENPHDLKTKVVKEGIANSGKTVEELRKDPMAAISAVGDPMMPAAAGVIAGASRKIPVIMAGGTQMAAVLAIIKGMDAGALKNVAIGTTRWITADKCSSIADLVKQIGKVPIIAANLDFSQSKYDGLRIYETGLVKEGVGAGGSTIAAITGSKGAINARAMLTDIDATYERLMVKMA
jgi:uncharacterized protein (TIGR00303 family)